MPDIQYAEFPSDFGLLGPQQLTKSYRDIKKQFRESIRRAIRVSRGSGGILVDGNRLAYASVLFTRICVRARSLEILLPDCKPDAHWDFSSVASLTRNLIEAYFWYFWLCEDEIDEDVRQGRFILLYCHDYGSRGRLWPDPQRDEEQADVLNDLVQRFDANSFLQTYSPAERREALRGHKTPFIQDEILERMGVPTEQFRVLYRFFSQHTHSGPISFFRSRDLDMGAGAETVQEKRYMIMALTTALDILTNATAGHLSLFPDAEVRPIHLTRQQVRKNVEENQGRKAPR